MNITRIRYVITTADEKKIFADWQGIMSLRTLITSEIRQLKLTCQRTKQSRVFLIRGGVAKRVILSLTENTRLLK